MVPLIVSKITALTSLSHSVSYMIFLFSEWPVGDFGRLENHFKESGWFRGQTFVH